MEEREGREQMRDYGRRGLGRRGGGGSVGRGRSVKESGVRWEKGEVE